MPRTASTTVRVGEKGLPVLWTGAT